MKQSKKETKPKATLEKLPIENLTMMGCFMTKERLNENYYESVIDETDNFWLND